MTSQEILDICNEISYNELTKVVEVKRTPKAILIRASDKRGDLYLGLNNGAIYHIYKGIIHKSL